jgi:DHA1 family bicyclomycin/chloramphenicol resistance-like MFS transporter
MAPFSKGAGSASALMGAIQMVFGALASALVGVFFNGTGVPMAAIMAFCAVSGFIILLAGHRRMVLAASQDEIEHQTMEMIEKF